MQMGAILRKRNKRPRPTPTCFDTLGYTGTRIQAAKYYSDNFHVVSEIVESLPNGRILVNKTSSGYFRRLNIRGSVGISSEYFQRIVDKICLDKKCYFSKPRCFQDQWFGLLDGPYRRQLFEKKSTTF